MAAAAAAAARCAAGAGAARMAAWRAHAYGPPGELRLDSARVPPLRAPDDVLVRVHHASINPLDVAMIGGYGWRVLNALRALEGERVEFPLVPGRDFAGEVAAAGGAARVRRGQRVWGVVPPHRAGSHAQYVLVKDRWLSPAPGALAPEAAGGALYAALSACAVLRAAGLAQRARRPPRVLLLGLGGVGHAALQLLVHRGAHVLVGCSRELHARALAHGAAEVLARDAPDYDRQLVDGGPYDAIVDCAGLGGEEAAARRWRFARFATLTTPLLRETDARGLALGGAAAGAALLAQCAAAPPPPAPPPPAPPPPACAPRVRWAYFMPLQADIEMLRRLAERGEFQVAVERVFAWRRGAAAYARAAAGHARGKLLLDFTAPDE
ncbi:reticulon-4-interacting protein 1 homolog, mitochondrial-like [Epargyreus clarus]|uniref:reticulon-4-interacting protein 1 homolog, mitochondrial-like n=1 Tax=Epargyreus clarus TaxID=520877 RepID=UPI003C2BAE85